jgi:hypothetical protein
MVQAFFASAAVKTEDPKQEGQMYCSRGNYEAFACPRKPDGVSAWLSTHETLVEPIGNWR